MLFAPARLVAVLLVALFASCGAGPPEPSPDALRLLFIGNSLTAANDMPGLVERLAARGAARTVRVGSVAYGGFSLEDHWNQGDAVRAIRTGGWDLVVLQQGPSARPDSRVLLVDYAGRFAAEIRAVGARPAMYMVWPPLDRASEWDDVSASYAAAAAATGAALLPAGEAIRAARAAHPGLALFAGDGFHPTLAGSYAAALVIYAGATGTPPLGLTARSGAVALPAADVAALEAGAAAALEGAGVP